MGCPVSIQNTTIDCGEFVLHDVSLEIESNEIFALLGRTGSGKSILLESIAGAFDLSKGRIFIDGTDAAVIPVRKRHMGIVYQDYALFPHLTVLDNVAYGPRHHGMKKEEAYTQARKMLERFGIDHLCHRYPDVISGGESQRVALARALVLEPEILLLDEPFSALDPATKINMYDLLREIHKELSCTIIFVTHDFNEACALANRIGIILDGHLCEVVDAKRLFEDSHSAEVDRFLGHQSKKTLP